MGEDSLGGRSPGGSEVLLILGGMELAYLVVPYMFLWMLSAFPAAEWLYMSGVIEGFHQLVGFRLQGRRTSPGDAAYLVQLLCELYSTVPISTSPPFSSISSAFSSTTAALASHIFMTDIDTLPVLPTGGFGEQRRPQPA